MNDFDRVKEKLNILEVITGETGLGMKAGHLEKCPFPGCGRTKCFSIQEDKQFFKCFKCDSKGDVFKFYRGYYGDDDASALKRGADRAGFELKPRRKAKKQAGGVDLTMRERIFREAATHYNGNLSTNGSKEYLFAAKGHTEDVLKKMCVGWSTGALVEHLRIQGYSDKDIQASGLGKAVMFNDIELLADVFPKGCAVYPWFERERVLKLTFKDPGKKKEWQLKKEYWAEGCRFFNQDALHRFNEIIVVEGENDVVSIRGADIECVIGLGGGPTDVQMKALKSYAASKHLYLWMDNDEDTEKLNIKGKGYVRRICNELAGLANVHIVRCGEDDDDPNSYLRAFKGDRRKEVKRLQLEAVGYITWEIGEIANLDGLEVKLNALKNRGIFAAVADMSLSEKEASIEKIERMSGLSKEAIGDEVERGYSLKNKIATYLMDHKKDTDPNEIGKYCFQFFSEHGRLFHDKKGTVWLFFRQQLEVVSNSNNKFKAIMNRFTGLLYSEAPGRSVYESLICLAINSGGRMELSLWTSANEAKRLVYLNLNAQNSMILKLSVNGVEEISNAMNDDGVFLRDSDKIMPVNFMQEVKVQEGMNFLKELVFDNLACEKNQRYYVLCWLISGFLLDFVPYMMLLKFSGSAESGKSTAAKFLSMIFYGRLHLSDITAAGAYRAASNAPLLILEDLEKEDIGKTLKKFFRLSATRGEKSHSKDGGTAETIELQPKSLILTNAITDFEDPAIISRTWDILFSKEFWREDFIEMETLAAIERNRDVIMSAIMKFICADILPNLEKQRDYIVILRKEYPKHSKRRMDEYLVLLMLILEKMLKYLPVYDPQTDIRAGVELGDKEIRQAWIEYQDAKAKDTEVGTSSLLKLLDGLVKEYIAFMNKDMEANYHNKYEEKVFVFTHPDYLLEMVKSKVVKKVEVDGDTEYFVATIDFVAKSEDFVYAFDKFCKNSGKKNSFDTARVFGAHLKNNESLLNKAGWKIVLPEKPRTGKWSNYYKVRNGAGYWKLQKTIVTK